MTKIFLVYDPPEQFDWASCEHKFAFTTREAAVEWCKQQLDKPEDPNSELVVTRWGVARKDKRDIEHWGDQAASLSVLAIEELNLYEKVSDVQATLSPPTGG